MRCETCGGQFESYENPMSQQVSDTLEHLDCCADQLVTDVLRSAKHPMCPECFIGWLHNVLDIGRPEDYEK